MATTVAPTAFADLLQRAVTEPGTISDAYRQFHNYSMGVRASTAWRVIYEGRKALWALSHCGPVDYALDKRYFAEQGLFALEHQYRDMHRVIAPAQLTLALE